jgi:hypothetical protein
MLLKKIALIFFISAVSLGRNAYGVEIYAHASVETGISDGSYSPYISYDFSEHSYASPYGDYPIYSDAAPSDVLVVGSISNSFDFRNTNCACDILRSNSFTTTSWAPTTAAVAEVGFKPQPFLNLSASSPDFSAVTYQYLSPDVSPEGPGGYISSDMNLWVQRIPKVNAGLSYGFTVHASPNTLVPVNFSSAINFKNDTDWWSRHYASLEISGLEFSIALVNYDLWYNDQFFEGGVHSFALEKTLSSPNGRIDFFGDPVPGVGHGLLHNFSTSVNGTVFIATDASGLGYGSVRLRGEVVNGSTFIDPLLTIDQGFLNDHPDAIIILPEGVGNTAAVVPEPSSYFLFISGMMVVLVLSLKREGFRKA